MKDKTKITILFVGIIIVIIVIVIIASILIKNNTDNRQEKNEQSVSEISNKVEDEETESNEEIINELKKKTEAERIRTYLGTYFRYIEKKQYESAYNLLYSEFKEKYFPTLEDYEKYLQEQDIPAMLTIDYDQITTQGELYIVTVRIGNMMARSDTQKVEKKFIIKENNYNDYYISFKK